jgi:hypothetical protein
MIRAGEGRGLELTGLRPWAERQAPLSPYRAGLSRRRSFRAGVLYEAGVVFYAALDGGLPARLAALLGKRRLGTRSDGTNASRRAPVGWRSICCPALFAWTVAPDRLTLSWG